MGLPEEYEQDAKDQKHYENEISKGAIPCPDEFCGGLLYFEGGIYTCDACGQQYEEIGGKMVLITEDK